MRNRILAIVGALALVAVALVVRGVLADDDGGSGPGGASGQLPVVACSPGLEPICETLAEAGFVDLAFEKFDLESPGATTGLVDGRHVAAWITWDPAGPISNFDLDAPVWGTPVTVGSSPLLVASHRDLPPACRDAAPTWSCVVGTDQVMALGTPSTIDGLLRAEPIAAALQPDRDFIGSTELGPLRALYEGRNSVPGPMMKELATINPGFYDSIVVTKAGAAVRSVSDTATPAGVFAMTLVVTPHVDASIDWIGGAFDDDAVRAAVRSAGVEPGEGTLADEKRAGELHALRQEIAP